LVTIYIEDFWQDQWLIRLVVLVPHYMVELGDNGMQLLYLGIDFHEDGVIIAGISGVLD